MPKTSRVFGLIVLYICIDDGCDFLLFIDGTMQIRNGDYRCLKSEYTNEYGSGFFVRDNVCSKQSSLYHQLYFTSVGKMMNV